MTVDMHFYGIRKPSTLEGSVSNGKCPRGWLVASQLNMGSGLQESSPAQRFRGRACQNRGRAACGGRLRALLARGHLGSSSHVMPELGSDRGLLGLTCLSPPQVQGMSFIAAVLILNLDAAEAFVAFSNLLNKPCQMAFFRVDHGLVSIPCICVPALCPHAARGA